MICMLRRAFAILCLCTSLFAAGDHGVWLDVPFVKQKKDGCGSASIAMVMQYWLKQQEKPMGASADPAEIQRALYSRAAHGIYASDVERYFHRHGFQTFAFRGTWDDLRNHLAKGRPLIVALRPRGVDAPVHYVVVVGFSGQQSDVLLNDPAQRKLFKEDRSSFENQWRAAGQWTLLALPQPEGG